MALLAVPKNLYRFSVDQPIEENWKKSGPKCQVEMKAWPNGEPGLTGFFTYQADPDGYPSIKLDVPSLGFSDWRSVKSVSIEILCPQECHPYFEIRTEKDKAPMGWYGFKSAPGRNTLVLQIDDKTDWDLSCVKTIDIFSVKPTEPWSIYVGDITLELRDPAAEAARNRAELKKLQSAYLWRQAALGRSMPEPGRRLGMELTNVSENPTADDVARLSASCREVFPQLDILVFKFAAKSAPMGVLWALPEEKIHFGDYAFLNRMTPKYEIDAAQGEGESAQLVGYAFKDAKEVLATLETLPALDDGTELPAWAVKLSPVGYVETVPAHYVVDYTGYWPDPILEYLTMPFSVEAKRYQSWWLDVRVPMDQKPGLYKGAVKVMVDGNSQVMPFTVRVRGFVLEPGAPYFCPVAYNSLKDYPADEAKRAAYKSQVADLLLSHRMQPDDIYYGCNKKDAVAVNKSVLARGAKFFNFGYVNGPLKEESLQRIREYYERYKAEGMLDKAYIYVFDEATADKFPMIRETLLKLREAAPGIPIYTTLYDGTFGIASGLDDLVDGWIPGTASFSNNTENITAARARGKKVGWYVACSPYLPYANFLMEYPGAAPRLLMGFMAKKINNDDIFLYYASGMYWEWTKGDNGTYKHVGDISVPVDGGPILKAPWNGVSFQDFNGDGRLVYPAPGGPIPCLRLKYIRDGIEDAMYIDLLKKCLANSEKMSQKWRDAAERELQIEDALVTDLTHWSREPLPIHQKHKRLADLLEQYFK